MSRLSLILGALLVGLVSIPFAAALLAVVILLDLVGWLISGGRVGTNSAEDTAPDTSVASIIILNWNGGELLTRSLPLVLEAVRLDGAEHEVIVVDNGSDDGSPDLMRDRFPQVRLIELPENLGFAEGNNHGARQARHDVVVFLNNDMFVDGAFLRPLLAAFHADQRVFAATSWIVQCGEDGGKCEETGRTQADLDGGYLRLFHELHDELDTTVSSVLYASGGCAAFDRRKFLALGGFDKLYQPCYVEDTDLSIRAWRRGWQCLFVPSSRARHLHRQTSNRRFGPGSAVGFIQKNLYVLMWRTLAMGELWRHVVSLPWHLPARVGNGGGNGIKPFLAALRFLPAALGARYRDRHDRSMGLGEVLEVTRSRFAYRERFASEQSIESRERLRILILCPYVPYPPEHGGAVRIFNVVKALSVRHEVHLVSFVEHPGELEYVRELERIAASVKLVLRTPDRRRTVLLPDLEREFRSAEMQRVVEEITDRIDFDIVHCEYLEMARYVPRSTRIATGLAEVQVTFVSKRREWENAARGRRLSALGDYAAMLDHELRTMSRFDLVFAMSATEAELLADYCPSLELGIFENGVDTSLCQGFTSVRAAPNGQRVLFLGHFRHTPNTEGILFFHREIWPLVQAKVPDARLTIAGPEPPDEVRALASPHVEVLGRVSDLRPLFQSAVVSVAPILTASGTRIKILDSFARGTPVVATTVGAEGLDVTDGVHLLLADDAEDFAAGTASLLTDPALGGALATAAAQLVCDRYGWDAIARRVEAKYRSVLKRKHSKET